MDSLVRFVLLVCSFQLAEFTDPPCVIELGCAECIPDNMPLVTSHRAKNGTVVAESGDEVLLSCGAGAFLAYPLHSSLAAVCEAGAYRVRRDAARRHLLELGCQENIFEDVLHEVEHCAPPLQGRAYRMQARHLATLCFDADGGAARALHSAGGAGPALPPHRERAAPLSLLGNFNHMFDAKTRHDAERLYSDDASLNRRLREMFKHDDLAFAGQTLTSAKLLGGEYFDDQDTRVTDFVSNRVAVWRSVAEGNLRLLHGDVGERARAAELDVFAGTHGVLALRTPRGRDELFLKAERRFPVPQYIWTVLHERAAGRALALVVLNDPFVTVSDIRAAVFCESVCARVSWLRGLLRLRHFERPLNGLVFCCALPDFLATVSEMPNIFNSSVELLL